MSDSIQSGTVQSGNTEKLREEDNRLRQMIEDIENRDRLLNIINHLAIGLLSSVSGERFEESLVDGMRMIGECLEADSVQIWSNEGIDENLRCVLRYKWLSEAGLEAPSVDLGTSAQYSESLLNMFERDEVVTGPITGSLGEDQDPLSPCGFTSTTAIPLYYHERFWGIFCLADYIEERSFTEEEIKILRSAALMLVNAIERHLRTEDVEEAQMRTKLLLDKTPLAVHLWNRDLQLFDCNEEALRLFNAPDKEEYLSEFYDRAPVYQSNGYRTRDLAPIYLNQAFDEGYLNFEWTYQTLDGETWPADITLVRVEYGDDYAVAAYSRDLTEHKRMMQELEQANELNKVQLAKLNLVVQDTDRLRKEAEAANHAKSTFLSTMSHEIRTPMNAILGITEMQLQKNSLSQEMREAFEKIYMSGDLLLGIINDILDLSKIEADKLELLIDKYELVSMVSDTAQVNTLRIGSKPIDFELCVDEDTPACLLGDELRIKQILNNLLSNAFKYTSEGTVCLSIWAEKIAGDDENTMLVLSVKDTGQGMTEEQIEMLFDEYARFNTETNRSTEGTGLGMSIARNLLQMMGGTISIESEPGKGSTFLVRLPQGNAGDEVLGRTRVDNLHEFRTQGRAQMKGVQITREPMPYGSVLVVDDVETNIYVARGLLAPYGLKIDTAYSAFSAIEKIKSGKSYDVVFMDHMMPKMDGIEATSIIRDLGYDRPIVALTANAVAGQAEVFLANGFDDYISKPIDVRQLDTILNKLIRVKKAPEVVGAARKQATVECRFSGGQHTAIDSDIIEAFLRDAAKSLVTLEDISGRNDYNNKENLRTFLIHIHGIKSALANIGEMDLSAIAFGLETAGREAKLDIVASHTPAFLNSLKAYVEARKTDVASEESDTKDEDQTFLYDQLLVIRSACEDYDRKTAKKAIEELKKQSWSRVTRDLISTLSECLLHGDFDDIVDLINENLEAEFFEAVKYTERVVTRKLASVVASTP